MNTAEQFFAQSYAEARGKFLDSAEAAGLDVESHPHPMVGRDGETLAMDVVRDGPADAPAVLLLSSACHGVEGFCGSGAQIALLGDANFRRSARDAGVAVLYLHGLNPYGFSWWRRTTHENVDLNRNFHDFSKPLPRNTAYDDVSHLIVPAHWPPSAEVEAGVAQYIATHGMKAWQAAVSGGQYEHPEGLFYGGRNPTWSQQALRHVLRDHGQRCQRLGWIDFHTGLGPSGHGERIFACRDDAQALARARAWWGPEVTSIYDGSSTSAPLVGLMWLAAYEECAQAEYTGIALEYGTVQIDEVLNSLRADQWLENHPEVDHTQADAIKRRIRDAFYTDTPVWKQQIVEQAADAARQAVAGLQR
ncbi:M14 family metallopeptidase [Aquabacterium sp.]|uniref:M14 family metallopeptidase n=1 Tax=Aquabacterium sp. TaxID=1872578 RepID=UPI002C54E9D6|nr:M14 family metallopeptidase [Aquabacterium sp.]HSW06102.1 M14 family metallopeptidase [Aquabacterium sp.]